MDSTAALDLLVGLLRARLMAVEELVGMEPRGSICPMGQVCVVFDWGYCASYC